MSKFALKVLFIAVFLVFPVIAFGAGGHDGLTCNGCHSLHKAKSDFIIAVEPNTKDVNPRTNAPYGGSTALCLACHQSPEKGGHGMTAISGGSSHPYGLTSVNARVATVPPELIRNGRFECSSCHNPHPSNTNPKYLIMDTSGSSGTMETFCAVCHPTKADPQTVKALQSGASAGGQAPAQSDKSKKKK